MVEAPLSWVIISSNLIFGLLARLQYGYNIVQRVGNQQLNENPSGSNAHAGPSPVRATNLKFIMWIIIIISYFLIALLNAFLLGYISRHFRCLSILYLDKMDSEDIISISFLWPIF